MSNVSGSRFIFCALSSWSQQESIDLSAVGSVALPEFVKAHLTGKPDSSGNDLESIKYQIAELRKLEKTIRWDCVKALIVHCT